MQWNENVSLLKTIVTEIIQEQMIPPQLHNAIFTDFDKLSAYYGNNLSVYNYDYNVINKEFLSRLHNSMQTINKVVHDGDNEDNGDMLITKDQIMNKRQNEFNQHLKNITDDFNKHTIQRPDDIDFSDKTDISLSNIDTLIKAEMEKRDIEINKKIDEADIKKAEEWFANKNTTITKVENQTTKKQTKQTKHKTKNKKQVSFQDNESQNNKTQDINKVDNLIEQLQNDRNKLVSYDVQEEKTIDMNLREHKQATTNIKPGEALIESPIKIYTYNTLLINTHCTVTKELFFMKSPINISLNNFKLLYVEIYKNKILLHKSECFLQETNNHLNYYRLTMPFNYENNDLEIRIFDDKKNTLTPSLDTILMKEEIITKDIVLYYNILPLGGIDIDNIFLVKVDNENCSIIRSMYDLEITCNDVKIVEFIPIFVKNIERKEKETIINIENIYDINYFNYLIMSKKYEQLLMDNDMITCISKKTMILTDS